MNAQTIEISASARGLVRHAIKTHPGWKSYAETHDTDLAQMTTKEAILRCCDALAIDVTAVIAGTFETPAAEAAETVEAASKPVRKPRIASHLSEQPVAAPAKTVQAPAASGQQLADLFAQIAASVAPAAAPLDMDQVRAAIDERLVSFGNALGEAFLPKIDAAIEAAGIVRIELKRGEEIKPLPGTHHPQFATLLKALSARMTDGHAPNIWIAGPAGSGKTHGAKSCASALGVPFHYNGALSMPHELLGFIDAGGRYHRTPFREAYEFGGVYLFDEVDGSDNSALLALNAALANGTATFPDGQIARHADCYIIATANTWGLGATAEYVGRSKIDAAFLSRFPVRLAWDYDNKLEQAICGNPDFAKRVQAARAKARSAGIKVLIDPRASMAGAALVAAGMSADDAASMTYLANLSADQRKNVEA